MASTDISHVSSPDMTPEVLKQLAIQHEGFEAPLLNDRLYLHFKGFLQVPILQEDNKANR
jgi:hypothetical protein